MEGSDRVVASWNRAEAILESLDICGAFQYSVEVRGHGPETAEQSDAPARARCGQNIFVIP
jgi:hypothetical protein